ncbi:MAG: DUF2846 domain-containing protein [Terriglobales bacterium]|jgi:hypothetical protein
MKTALIAMFLVMFLALSVFAQGTSSRLALACGPKDVTFTVKMDPSHEPAEPEPGKARVAFIQDDSMWGEHQHYVMKIGLDGAWVGAYKQNSYFTVSVDPGEHHVCANVQSKASIGRLLALAHFTAEPGKIYYFRTRFFGGMPGIESAPPYVDLETVDSDEAKYLMASFPQITVSQPIKP